MRPDDLGSPDGDDEGMPLEAMRSNRRRRPHHTELAVDGHKATLRRRPDPTDLIDIRPPSATESAGLRIQALPGVSA